MSRSGDFRGDNRQTDRQTDYFTPAHAHGVITYHLRYVKWIKCYCLVSLTCCSRFSLVALSLEEKSLTTQGTIFFWYSALSKSWLSLKSGAKTAEPAPPNSKAFRSWGRILCFEKFFGNEFKCLLSSVKNSFLCVGSMIWRRERERERERLNSFLQACACT